MRQDLSWAMARLPEARSRHGLGEAHLACADASQMILTDLDSVIVTPRRPAVCDMIARQTTLRIPLVQGS